MKKLPQELFVGDKVKMWSSYGKKLKNQIWIVTAVREAISQSMYVIDVEVPECLHCGAKRRTIVGYDASWFVKQ